MKRINEWVYIGISAITLLSAIYGMQIAERTNDPFTIMLCIALLGMSAIYSTKGYKMADKKEKSEKDEGTN